MSSWKDAKKILCIRLDAMGDVLMTTPAMEAMKECVQGRKLTLLTSNEGKEIAKSIPFIDKVIVYGAPWLKASAERKDPDIDFQMIDRIRSEKFDAAIIFTVYSQNPLPSAVLCYLADIPLRAAYCRENPYGLLTDWMKEKEPELMVRHEVRRHLDLVSELGAKGVNRPLGLKVDPEADISLEEKLKYFHLPVLKDWIVIHPGSTASSRRYSPLGFSEVADRLIGESQKTVLFTGGGSERSLITEIQNVMKHPSVNLGGILTLNEMIALLRKAPLLISNNSGPVHIAAALGTPVVDLYALTNPQHTPWMVSHAVLYQDVECGFCYKSVCPEGHNRCLQDVKVDDIYETGLALLRTNTEPCYSQEAIYPLKERL
jgi:lipopolysaccharide heptosyltransferase II